MPIIVSVRHLFRAAQKAASVLPATDHRQTKVPRRAHVFDAQLSGPVGVARPDGIENARVLLDGGVPSAGLADSGLGISPDMYLQALKQVE